MVDPFLPLSGVNARLPKTVTQRDVPTPTAQVREAKNPGQEFEKMFVAQMLKDAGFEKALTSGMGSSGETFGAIINDLYAQHIVENGGIGVSDYFEQVEISKGTKS